MLTEKTRETISRIYSARDELYGSPDGKTCAVLREEAARMFDKALADGKSVISVRADIFEYLLRNGRVGVPNSLSASRTPLKRPDVRTSERIC